MNYVSIKLFEKKGRREERGEEGKKRGRKRGYKKGKEERGKGKQGLEVLAAQAEE